MNTIKEINDQYVNAVKNVDLLTQYKKKIFAKINNEKQPEISQTMQAIKLLSELMNEINDYEIAKLKDICSIGNQYICCYEKIDSYRICLSRLDKEDSASVFRALDGVKEAQAKYDELKKDFFLKYNVNVTSLEIINQVICDSLKKALSEVQSRIEQLKKEAKKIVAAEYTTELKKTDPLGKNNRIPTELLVARTPVHDSSMAVLHDIGISYIYKNIFSDLRNQGNIMVVSDFEHIEDRRIDEFIIAYVMRFIENFPLGTLNVHIFDQNTNYLYKRLNNSFQNENASEVTKKIVQIHTSLSDLSVFRDVICEDIFRKTSVSKPDLYAVYEYDHSDPFNLIILRDGLIDGSGYVASEILDTINSLTKPNEIGHKCGLRFLIIDNSISFEKNLTANNKYFLDAIHQNCGIKFCFNDKAGFTYNEKSVEVLHIVDDLDTFVQERSLLIANALNSKEKSYISFDEVSAEETEKQPGNIMYIPIGKSGGNIVELPLSCKDEDGTVAGQCIGYIAIGQSGSGKSSFFHSLVLNGCVKYNPKDLQFWLLDFKNGGASSKYSNSGIPHIRIIA